MTEEESTWNLLHLRNIDPEYWEAIQEFEERGTIPPSLHLPKAIKPQEKHPLLEIWRQRHESRSRPSGIQ